MRIEEFGDSLARRASAGLLSFERRPPASPGILEAAEARLTAEMPANVRRFYAWSNGLTIEDPALAVLPVESLVRGKGGLVTFATVDHVHHLAFDLNRLNDAEEWNIVSLPTLELVTMTMSSFWSNKILGWIDKRKAIWRVER